MQNTEIFLHHKILSGRQLLAPSVLLFPLISLGLMNALQLCLDFNLSSASKKALLLAANKHDNHLTSQQVHT